MPKRRGLVDFTRLMSSGHEKEVAGRLERWIADTRDAKDAYLRNRIEVVLARDGRIDSEDPELIDWFNDTIRAEVNLADDSLFERAA